MAYRQVARTLGYRTYAPEDARQRGGRTRGRGPSRPAAVVRGNAGFMTGDEVLTSPMLFGYAGATAASRPATVGRKPLQARGGARGRDRHRLRQAAHGRRGWRAASACRSWRRPATRGSSCRRRRGGAALWERNGWSRPAFLMFSQMDIPYREPAGRWRSRGLDSSGARRSRAIRGTSPIPSPASGRRVRGQAAPAAGEPSAVVAHIAPVGARVLAHSAGRRGDGGRPAAADTRSAPSRPTAPAATRSASSTPSTRGRTCSSSCRTSPVCGPGPTSTTGGSTASSGRRKRPTTPLLAAVQGQRGVLGRLRALRGRRPARVRLALPPLAGLPPRAHPGG